MTQPTAEQLEVTQGFVCPKEEYAAFCTWAKNTLPFIDTPSVASHLFGAWIGSARHRLQTEARMSAAVEAERERCARIVERRAEARFNEHGTREWDTNATYYQGDMAEIYEALDEEADEIAAAIRSQSNG